MLCLSRVPVLSQQVRAEVGQVIVGLSLGEDVKLAQGVADRLVMLSGEHTSGGVRRASPPWSGLARAAWVEMPHPLHLQVRVHDGVTDMDQQVLATGLGTVNGVPGEICGGESRDPKVGGEQGATGQRLVEEGGLAVDAVTFGHCVGCFRQGSQERGLWRGALHADPCRSP